MNHDVTHCADWNINCPKSCYRAQITEDLRKIEYPWPVSFAMFRRTAECPLGDAVIKEAQYEED
jgi:hypothetical protein